MHENIDGEALNLIFVGSLLHIVIFNFKDRILR